MNNQAGVYEGSVDKSDVKPIRQYKPIIVPESSFLGILGDRSAYKSVLYLLFLFPMSIFIFTYTITGLSLSLGLAITIFGAPLLYVFLLNMPRLNQIQSGLAFAILDIEMPHVRLPEPRGGFLDKLGYLIKDEQVHRSLIASIVILPAAIFAFVFVFTTFSVSVAFMASVFYPITRTVLISTGVTFDEGQFMNIAYEVVPEGLAIALLVVVGLLLFITSLHVSKYLAYTHVKVMSYLQR